MENGSPHEWMSEPHLQHSPSDDGKLHLSLLSPGLVVPSSLTLWHHKSFHKGKARTGKDFEINLMPEKNWNLFTKIRFLPSRKKMGLETFKFSCGKVNKVTFLATLGVFCLENSYPLAL